MAAVSLPSRVLSYQSDFNHKICFVSSSLRCGKLGLAWERRSSFLSNSCSKGKGIFHVNGSEDILKSSQKAKAKPSSNLAITASAEENEAIPLLTPYKMGSFELKHRIVYAPLTRNRAIDNVPQAAACTYYSQRASEGGLMITEATCISPYAHGYLHTPGVYTQEQVEAWKPIIKAVKDKGAYFFCQIWHTGRASHPLFNPGGELPVAPSPIPVRDGDVAYTMEGPKEYPVPRELTVEEIPGIVDQYRVAARNAIDAGFDGIEIHGANGYLVDQFLKDGINQRTDAYGGSVANRARFAIEVVEAIAKEIGPEKLGIRLSPFGGYLDAKDSDPYATNVYLLEKLSNLNILYADIVEARDDSGNNNETIEPFRKAFKGTLIAAGGFKRDSANEAIKSNDADLVAFGRLFLANPDLPKRFELNAPLNAYDRNTFYTQDQVIGYTDYPFLEEAVVA